MNSIRLAFGACLGLVALLLFLILKKDFFKQYFPIPHKTSCTNKNAGIPIVYSYKNGWNKEENLCKDIDFSTYIMTPLVHIRQPMQVFVMDPQKDTISRIIIREKMFDEVDFDVMFKFFGTNPDYHFIDIGANVGVHSLKFAEIGKQVFSIEVSTELIQRLCASIYLNRFENQITLINNAIGAKHGNISYAKSNGDYGWNFIKEKHTEQVMKNTVGEKFFITEEVHKLMILDDLLELPAFNGIKKVFLKIDVEGYEHNVINGSSKFFDTIDVGGVYMEWNKQGAYETGDAIIQTMKTRGFKPYYCPSPDYCRLLKEENLKTNTIYNIIWLKRGFIEHG